MQQSQRDTTALARHTTHENDTTYDPDDNIDQRYEQDDTDSVDRNPSEVGDLAVKPCESSCRSSRQSLSGGTHLAVTEKDVVAGVGRVPCYTMSHGQALVELD